MAANNAETERGKLIGNCGSGATNVFLDTMSETEGLHQTREGGT